MKKVKTGLKIVIFIVVAALLFGGVSYILRPYFSDWGEPFSEYDFYNEPENTIETLFLGSSVTETGVIPLQLYEDYGICSFNLGTQSQPLMGSYYLAQETYRLHGETLDTIVLDVSKMQSESTDGMYIKMFDTMELSSIKLNFIKDYSENFEEFLDHVIPVLYYHDSWKSLPASNFLKDEYDKSTYTRGYKMVFNQALDSANNYEGIITPLYATQVQTEMPLEEESVTYLIRLIEFCKENDIKLVLMKTPQDTWSDEAHNAVQRLAEEYQLDYFDFNYLPLVDEISYDAAVDTRESDHLNYYGASNLTDWLGRYLTEECGNRDVRGDERYAFMDEELEEYHRKALSVDLNDITDPAEYLAYVMGQENYDIFISVKDDASDSLTAEQRKVFADLGLVELSQLSERASYLAVIDNGEVITEQMQLQDPELIDAVNADEEEEEGAKEALYLSYEGKLPGKTAYSIKSGGFDMGNISSIQIDGTEYSPDLRGLNIVVYDKELKQVVDQVTFDTYASPDRDPVYTEELLEETIQQEGTGALSGKLLELYQYDRLCEDTKTAKELKQETGDDNLSNYLQAFWDNDEFSIYLSANGDFAGALTDQERGTLANMGLSDLSELQKGDSYLAAVQSGEVVDEQCGQKGKEVQASGENYWLCSCGTAEDCSLMIRGTEYTGEIEGLYIAIYDNVLNRVVDFTVYDADGIFCANEEEE